MKNRDPVRLPHMKTFFYRPVALSRHDASFPLLGLCTRVYPFLLPGHASRPLRHIVRVIVFVSLILVVFAERRKYDNRH